MMVFIAVVFAVIALFFIAFASDMIDLLGAAGFALVALLAATGGTEAHEDYSREAFGGWSGWCIDAREEAIFRWADAYSMTNSCRIGRVIFTDPYTGEVYDGDSSGVDVDHVVPLKEAWDSGIDHRRLAEFHNDPLNLVPTSASVNRAKSDRDPASWLPPDPEARCWYVALWTAIKDRYDLTIDAREYRAIYLVQEGCR